MFGLGVGKRGFKDWLGHVIFVPIKSFKPVIGFGLLEEFGARIGDNNGGLEGVN